MSNYLLNELFVRLVTQTDNGLHTLPIIINRGGNNITRIPKWNPNIDYRAGTCTIHRDQIYHARDAVIGYDLFDPDKWTLVDPFNYYVKSHRIDKEYCPGTIVLYDKRCFINREFCIGEFVESEWDPIIDGYQIDTCYGYMRYTDEHFKQFDFSGTVIII